MSDYTPNEQLMLDVTKDIVIADFNEAVVRYAEGNPGKNQLAFKPNSVPYPPFCVIEYRLMEPDGSTTLEGDGWKIIDLDEIRTAINSQP